MQKLDSNIDPSYTEEYRRLMFYPTLITIILTGLIILVIFLAYFLHISWLQWFINPIGG